MTRDLSIVHVRITNHTSKVPIVLIVTMYSYEMSLKGAIHEKTISGGARHVHVQMCYQSRIEKLTT